MKNQKEYWIPKKPKEKPLKISPNVVKRVNEQTGKRMMDFLVCLKANGGLVTLAMKQFHGQYPEQKEVEWSEHALWQEQDDGYASAVRMIKEGIIDGAEGVLYTLIKQQSLPAVQYFLNHQGKKRGYNIGEKLMVEHSGEVKHNVAISFEDRPE